MAMTRFSTKTFGPDVLWDFSTTLGAIGALGVMVRRLESTPPPSLVLLDLPKPPKASVMPSPKGNLKPDLHFKLRPPEFDVLDGACGLQCRRRQTLEISKPGSVSTRFNGSTVNAETNDPNLRIEQLHVPIGSCF